MNDAEQSDSAELAAVEGLDADRVAVEDRGHADLGCSSGGRPGTRPTGTADLEHALWQQTATLLRQRRDWDRDHQMSPR